MSGGETSRSKKSGGKRPDPKGPDVKPLPKPLRHDCETSSMVVTLPEAFYDCEVLLSLSFKFDFWLVNWFELVRGNRILWIKNFHLEMIFLQL